MQESEDELNTLFEALTLSKQANANIVLMDEALLLLAQKRRTLEEKAIARHFHCVINAYSRLIALLHQSMSTNTSLDERKLVTVHKLRTVNEKVRNCVEDLLKIVRYNLNFLEQYYEYDYCTRLLNEETFLADLEAMVAELESQETNKIQA